MKEDRIKEIYVKKSLDLIADFENDLLELEKSGLKGEGEDTTLYKLLGAYTYINEGAERLGFGKIEELSEAAGTVLAGLNNGELEPEEEVTNALLLAFDKLRWMLARTDSGYEKADITKIVATLAALTLGKGGSHDNTAGEENEITAGRGT